MIQLNKYCWDDRIKWDEMGRTCGTQGSEEVLEMIILNKY
jgi:hypothetical protein